MVLRGPYLPSWGIPWCRAGGYELSNSLLSSSLEVVSLTFDADCFLVDLPVSIFLALSFMPLSASFFQTLFCVLFYNPDINDFDINDNLGRFDIIKNIS